jgi:hypothetical protein
MQDRLWTGAYFDNSAHLIIDSIGIFLNFCRRSIIIITTLSATFVGVHFGAFEHLIDSHSSLLECLEGDELWTNLLRGRDQSDEKNFLTILPQMYR